MARRPAVQALQFIEVSDLPADGVVVRKDGRSYAAPLPEEIGDASPDAELFVVPKRKMLTPKEAGEIIGISTSRVKQLLDAGAMRHEFVGRDRRIPVGEAVAYRDKRRRRIDASAEGFMSSSEFERPEPAVDEILKDVE
ncbi:MAG: helix-turn-helix domain-containing protein [Patulibacter sp.]|nr:helix-turn-helix domain-containing protein [Patulibacter sp.]